MRPYFHVPGEIGVLDDVMVQYVLSLGIKDACDGEDQYSILCSSEEGVLCLKEDMGPNGSLVFFSWVDWAHACAEHLNLEGLEIDLPWA